MQTIKQNIVKLNYDAFRSTSIFGSLDGLRCLSTLAVIWHHAGSTNNSWPPLNKGFLGVDLFFVISGFLIVTLLLRERSATSRISLRKFYIRRFLRIFPLYYGTIFGLATIYMTVGRNSSFGMRFLSELPYYITFVADFVPVSFSIVWSLAAEEQFYVFWPSVEKYFATHIGLILAVMVILNQVVNFPVGRNAIGGFVGTTNWTDLNISQTTFTPIILGVLTAHLLHSEKGYRIFFSLFSSRWASSVYLLLLLCILTIEPNDISGWPRLATQLCMTALLASCVYREDHSLQPLLSSGPVRNVGKISYGMYLLHIQVVGLLMLLLHERSAHGSVRLFVCTLILTVVLAWLSFRFFEEPFLRLKHKYAV